MTCKICGSKLELLGSVPFDKNNADVPIVDTTPMDYYKCTKCYNIICPEIVSWTLDQIGSTIYNEEYIKYDPDYKNGVRAKDYAQFLIKMLGSFKGRHLDYGSGEGLLAKELNWDSTNYDPYSSTDKPIGLFNLITAIEVIEHSSDLDFVIKDMLQYLDKRGVILFSTTLVDKNTPLSCGYISPRNGHINMQSKESLKVLAIKNNMFFDSIAGNIHLFQSTRNNFKDLQRGMRW